jgi:hypothetical protein
VIEAGKSYRFLGLPKGDSFAYAPDGDRTLKVLSISTSGNVSYVIELDEPISDDNTMAGVGLLMAERMIELGIWREVDE